ncbi:dual specificity protein phosphatase family protein [Mariniblastus sp.]|nr:dual specificity protein phosphatase family protein [Mariniblastus sp.]
MIRGQNHWDEIEAGLFLGAFPSSSDISQLHSRGVRAIVNTCEESVGHLEQYRQLTIEQLRVPTVDFTEPTIEGIRQAIEFIDRNRNASDGIYVHCKSGRGRSATVVLCWLIKQHGQTPEEAQQRLSQLRGQVLSTLYRRKCVQQFWNELQKKDSPQA